MVCRTEIWEAIEFGVLLLVGFGWDVFCPLWLMMWNGGHWDVSCGDWPGIATVHIGHRTVHIYHPWPLMFGSRGPLYADF